MKSTQCKFQPVILIGAARSGTKLLRDLIAAHPEVDKVPYDINFIWRLGNERIPHDELPAGTLSPHIRSRIRGHIARFSKGAPLLVEKTVSNSLRIPFVDGVFPEAKYIHLVRNGMDVVESAHRQWRQRPGLLYILKKLAHFPIKDAFGYGMAYAGRVLRKLVFPSRDLETWGQRYAGIDDDVRQKELIEVCAIQWARSLETALEHLGGLLASRVLTIRYRDLVERPLQVMQSIGTFLELDYSAVAGQGSMQVQPGRLNTGRSRLSREQQEKIAHHMEGAMLKLSSLEALKPGER